MRGAKNLKRQLKGVINIDGVALSKVLYYIRLTGGMPSMTGKDPSGHMLYIRDEMPQVYAQTYQFLNVLDYMNLRLTGRYVATVDSILTSWVTDNRDPANIHYDERLIKRWGSTEKITRDWACTPQADCHYSPKCPEELGLGKTLKSLPVPSTTPLLLLEQAPWKTIAFICMLALLHGWQPMCPTKRPI